MERVDQLVSGFLKRRYGTPISRILAKLRVPLLKETERVACNLCGADTTVELARRDKYRLAVTSVMCRNCGLMYLNPRPSVKSYDEFYLQGGDKDGVYHVSLTLQDLEPVLQRYFGPEFRMSDEDRAELRAFVNEKHREHIGKTPSDTSETALVEVLESKAKEHEAAEYDAYAEHVYQYFKEFVPRGGKVLEMGAAWGKLLVPWRDQHGCEVTGVEPRARTVQTAKDRLGIELFQGFPATAKVPEQSYDAVFNLRTINHMLDPLGDLRHAWRWLKPGGIICVDISDALKEARYESFEGRVLEIDHPYMFSANSLAALLQKAGFEIVKREIVDSKNFFPGVQRQPEYKQIRIVGRKSLEPVAVALPDPVAELAELFQATQAWNARQDERGTGKRKSGRSKPEEGAAPGLLKRARRKLRRLFSPRARSKADRTKKRSG